MSATYINENKINLSLASPAKLMIIDTVDYYIMSIDRTKSSNTYFKANDNTFSKVCKLYEEMDIPIDILETPFKVTTEEFEMITNICGKNIPISKESYIVFSPEPELTFQSLLIDLSKIIEFSKIQLFWNKRKQPIIDRNNVSTRIDKENELTNGSDGFKDDNNKSAFKRQFILPNVNNSEDVETTVEAFSDPDCIYKLVNEKDNITNTEDINYLPTYIIYNNLYNTSLVINENADTIKLIENDFPEFTVVDKLMDLSDNNSLNIHNFFHKKMFDSIEDIKSKIESFRVLYSIKDDSNLFKDYTEKEEVIMIINRLYDQNTNPSDKIKATELYSRIEHLSKPENQGNLAFRKRVARYLIEIGLTRKRVSDGIYYYGLVYKNIFTADSIEDLEEKRKIDEELYRPPAPLVVKAHPLTIAQQKLHSKKF